MSNKPFTAVFEAIVDTKKQPAPVANNEIPCFKRLLGEIDLFAVTYLDRDTANDKTTRLLVKKDVIERAEFGKQKYGVYLQPFNGRDTLVDLYNELSDAAVYGEALKSENPDDIGLELRLENLLEFMLYVRHKIYLRDGK